MKKWQFVVAIVAILAGLSGCTETVDLAEHEKLVQIAETENKILEDQINDLSDELKEAEKEIEELEQEYGPLGQGCDATNGWSRPLLFIEGMTPYGITSGARSGGRAIVDGVELIQATTDDWYGSVALFARLNGMATLRRFTFGDRNILSIPTGLNKTQGILFYLNDTGENILEDCFVSIEDTTTYGGLVERVVYAEGTNDIIRNNRIYLASASTIGILQAISVDDDFVLVENNYVHNLSGSFTASTYAIYGSSQAQFLRFISNYVYTATCTASQPLIYLNRSDSQLTVVTSNILYSADANAPTIGTAGGTPVGNTDNVLA